MEKRRRIFPSLIEVSGKSERWSVTGKTYDRLVHGNREGIAMAEKLAVGCPSAKVGGSSSGRSGKPCSTVLSAPRGNLSDKWNPFGHGNLHSHLRNVIGAIISS